MTARKNRKSLSHLDVLKFFTWFVLQDSQLLEPHMNLVEQCVQGEGLVQINVELKSEGGIKKINIVDVLKPADDNLRQKTDIF